MFSQEHLINFVFANENDIYYGEDLLKLDVNQQLWFELHKKFDAVYFLSSPEHSSGSKLFNIRSFGDSACFDYVPEKRGFFNKSTDQEAQASWIIKRLQETRGNTSAFVCSLEDFCQVMESRGWQPVLSKFADIKKRSGIFVLTASATAEKSAPLLLKSPVFAALKDPAVNSLREDIRCELYGTLKYKKGECCQFLNCYTREGLRGLLLQLLMEYPERMGGSSQLDELTDYLYAWLHEPKLAGGVLLDKWQAPGYMLYKELYAQLDRRLVWQRLEEGSRRFAAAGVCISDKEYIPVLRDKSRYAWECINFRMDDWVSEDKDALLQGRKLLSGIQKELAAPLNLPENEKMALEASKLISLLRSVSPGDSESVLQILRALRFCVSYVYTEDSREAFEPVKLVIDSHHLGIKLARDRFRLYELLREYSDPQSSLAAAIRKSNENKLLVVNAQLENIRNIISAQEQKLAIPDSVGDIKALQDEINKIIAEMQQSNEASEPSVDEKADLPVPEEKPAVSAPPEDVEDISDEELDKILFGTRCPTKPPAKADP